MWRRLGIFLLMAVAILACKWGRPVVRHVAHLYSQRQCLNFSAPPDEVVFESDPVAAEKMVAQGKARPVGIDMRGTDWFSGKPTTRMAGRTVPAWNALTALPAAYPEGGEPCILFLHELRTGNGISRLVMVRGYFAYAADANRTIAVLQAIARTIEPWQNMRAPVPVITTTNGPTVEQGLSGRLQFLAGQMDPANPAHLLLPFELNSKRGLIDAILKDDGALEFSIPQKAGGDWQQFQLFY